MVLSVVDYTRGVLSIAHNIWSPSTQEHIVTGAGLSIIVYFKNITLILLRRQSSANLDKSYGPARSRIPRILYQTTFSI